MDGACAGSWSLISLQMSCDRIDIFSPSRITLKWNFCRLNVARWACTHSKASINDSMGGTGVVCRLHHLVNKNYQQELGCDSSGWWRNCWWRDWLFVALSSIFAKRVDLLWGIVAPAQILGHWPWRLPFSWRFTWKSDRCHFQEAPTSSVNLVILDLLSLLSLQGRWDGARVVAFLSTFCNGIGEF